MDVSPAFLPDSSKLSGLGRPTPKDATNAWDMASLGTTGTNQSVKGHLRQVEVPDQDDVDDDLEKEEETTKPPAQENNNNNNNNNDNDKTTGPNPPAQPNNKATSTTTPPPGNSSGNQQDADMNDASAAFRSSTDARNTGAGSHA